MEEQQFYLTNRKNDMKDHEKPFIPEVCLLIGNYLCQKRSK